METDSVYLQAYKEEQHRLGDWTSGPLLIESWQDDSKKNVCMDKTEWTP